MSPRKHTRFTRACSFGLENPPPKRMLCEQAFSISCKSMLFFWPKILVFALREKPNHMQIEVSTNGASSSMQNIGPRVIKNLWVSSTANYLSRTRIVAYIADALKPINTAISRLEREIDLLREYRTRLIADVVTGKLDVREAAARLPDNTIPTAQDDDADLDTDIDTIDEEAPS